MLQSPRLEDYMKTIGIDQSLFNRSSSFEQIFFNNIKNIYQHAVKCDNQKNLEDILDAAMGVDVMGKLGLSSVTYSGVNTIAASRISSRFFWLSHLTVC